MNVDLAKTIAPKSDQLNADDLIAGPITITITQVKGSDEPDQPVSICFEGDGGKPYKPCKSMRRVLVHCWGREGAAYPGRRLTLYRDDNVQFGGIKVGGIRISHMSHIPREMEMALTVTKARRAAYKVKPLQAEVVQSARRPPADDRQTARREEPPPADEEGFAGGGFGGSVDEDPGAEASEARKWARGVQEDLETEAFTTSRQIQDLFENPESHRLFGELTAEDAAHARRLEASLKGRQKALADRERSQRR